MLPLSLVVVVVVVVSELSLASSSGEPFATVSLSIDPTNVTHQLRKLDMGCHSDTGYSHQPMGLHAQRIYGPSFEAPAPVHADTDGTGWVDVSHGAGLGGAAVDATMAFHGQSSEKLTFSGNTGTGRAAVANRGLGNEGLFFEGGKEYEGYFFASAANKSVNLVVSLEAWSVNGKAPVVLASSTVTVEAGSGWKMFNFSLTPSTGTECDGITPGGAVAKAANITCPVNGTYNPDGVVSDRTAHICVRCGGQFVIALQSPGTVNLDYVYLSPGAWGRFKGLPVLADGVKWLQGMGTSLFRMGGSFCAGVAVPLPLLMP